MLNNPGNQAIKCFLSSLKILIHIGHSDPWIALHVFANIRNAQTAFIKRPWLSLLFLDFRIDKNPFERSQCFALSLIQFLARDYGTTPIAQYWIQQALQVEPAMAKRSFTQEFLDTYFQPEVAAKCGQVG